MKYLTMVLICFCLVTNGQSEGVGHLFLLANLISPFVKCLFKFFYHLDLLGVSFY